MILHTITLVTLSTYPIVGSSWNVFQGRLNLVCHPLSLQLYDIAQTGIVASGQLFKGQTNLIGALKRA